MKGLFGILLLVRVASGQFSEVIDGSDTPLCNIVQNDLGAQCISPPLDAEGNYLDGLECATQVQGTLDQYEWKLFDLEFCPTCECDFVTLETNDVVSEKFCGGISPIWDMDREGTEFILRFKSDNAISFPGFQLCEIIEEATESPVAEPAVTESPIAEPAVTEAPVAEPAVTESPIAEPTVTEAPVAEPAVPETTNSLPGNNVRKHTATDDGHDHHHDSDDHLHGGAIAAIAIVSFILIALVCVLAIPTSSSINLKTGSNIGYQAMPESRGHLSF